MVMPSVPAWLCEDQDGTGALRVEIFPMNRCSGGSYDAVVATCQQHAQRQALGPGGNGGLEAFGGIVQGSQPGMLHIGRPQTTT
jgi:hypothetical protein